MYDKKIAPAIEIKCAAGGDVSEWKISILSPSQVEAPGEDSWSTEELGKLSNACVQRFKKKGKNVQVIVTQKTTVKNVSPEDEAGEFLLEDAPTPASKKPVNDQVIGTVGSIQQILRESQATKGTDPESKAIDTDPNIPIPKEKKLKPERDAQGSAEFILDQLRKGKRKSN